MRFLIVFMIMIISTLLPHVLAEERLQINLQTSIPETRTIVAVVSYQALNTTDVTSTYELMEKGTGQITLLLSQGTYGVTLTGDSNNTPNPDYYAEKIIVLEKNSSTTLSLVPIGFLQGEVVDQTNNLVGGALLKLECTNPSTIQKWPTRTDQVGSIQLTAIQVGSCRIIAHYEESVGSEEFEIRQGQVTKVRVILSRSIAKNDQVESRNDSVLMIGAIIILVILLILLFLYLTFGQTFQKKQNGYPTIPEQSKKSVTLNHKQEAIMKTLTSMEQKTVQCLLEHNGKTTQAQIFHDTRIAKSNLFRVIHSLELKQIIITERFGKVKKVQITPFFNEK